MLKQATSEELVFKRLFAESLRLQKERMLEMKKYAREQSAVELRRQLDQIASLENAYKNKFELLNERMRSEKTESEVRERDQKLALAKWNRAMRSRLEREIRDMQQQMYRDKDFLHWRQLDADTAKSKLLQAGYITFDN